MGDAPPLDEDAPDEALLAEDGRSSPTSVGRVRKRAQIGAQLARGWERGATPLRRRLARSCCCLQTRSGSTSARLRGWGGETMLAGTRIPHNPHVRAHHAAIPPHSQAPSPSDAATPSGGLADDERDEAAAPPGWPARASRWPVQRGGTGSPILARALADARRSRERAKCGKMGLFANPSRRPHVGTSRIDDSPPAPACAPRNSSDIFARSPLRGVGLPSVRRDPVPVLGRLADRLAVPLLRHCVVLPRAPLPGVEGCWAGEAAAHTAESLLPAASGGVFVQP